MKDQVFGLYLYTMGIVKTLNTFILKRRLKRHTILRHLTNFSKAKNIAILFNASEPDAISAVKNYVSELKKANKKATLLGYKATKSKTVVTLPHFTEKELNWFKQPKSAGLKRFMTKDFDILINTNDTECIPLDYITALSRAKLRIGRYNPEKTLHYDLMISVNKEKSTEEFLKQTNHYLTIINK